MSNAYRLDQIRSFLIRKGTTSVEDLAQNFHVTPTTIRRDLILLEEQGVIERSRGFASILDVEATDNEHSFLAMEKKRIADKASTFISSDMTIALDSGSSVSALVDSLLERNDLRQMNIVTHSPRIALKASKMFNVSLVGGALLPDYDFVVGYDVEEYYRKVHLDLAVLGSTSVYNSTGLTVNYPLQLNVKKLAATCADHRIALLDSSKYFRRGVYVFCEFKDLDYLITVQTDENEEQLEQIAKQGVEIILV